MDTLLRDIRHALRGFRRHPGLVAVACLSLALGIGINVAMFAGVNTILRAPLPYPEPDRLVQVWQQNRERGYRLLLSAPNLVSIRERAKQSTVVGYIATSFNFAEQERPERINGMRVSGDFFPTLAAPFALGKGFSRDDETVGAGRVAVLGARFWTRRFAADSGVLGRTVLLDGEPYAVIGVTGAGFRFEGEDVADVYVPIVADPSARRDEGAFRSFARLAPGATIGGATAELERIGAALAAEFPTENVGMSFRIYPMIDEVIEEEPRRAGTITLVAVAFVLLIACANVANLLLARATGRDRELAVRSAVGADRARLIRGLLTESLVLAVLGGVCGIGFSYLGIGWLRSILPADFPRAAEATIDWASFGYAAIVVTLSGLAFGIAPAWRASRPDLTTSLRDGARGVTGLRHGRVLSVLVGFEVALALVLLISAGLLIKSTVRIASRDPGFDAKGVLAFRTTLSTREYPDSASLVRFGDNLLAELRGIEQVTSVGSVTRLPMMGALGTFYWLDGEAEPEPGKAPIATWRGISPGYLETMAIAMVAGRTITAGDRVGSPRVALINETFARRHWEGASPIGRAIHVFGNVWEIVGVVRDTRERDGDDPTPPVMLLPAAQVAPRGMSFVLRAATSDPTAILDRVRAAVARVAPGQPIYQVEPLTTTIARVDAENSIMPKLLGVFGAMAMLLAVVGIYGVMSYSVAQRTQEMGVRRALGAPDRTITRMVLTEAAKVSGIGGLAGLAMALLSTRALSSWLYGVSAFDPMVFGGVTLALLAAALGASLLPARRATRVDPIRALRSD